MTNSKYLERCNNVPTWILAKVVEFATARNDIMEMRSGVFIQAMADIPRGRVIESLLELEQEAAILLRLDLELNPALATLVPEEFINGLKKNYTASNLTPLERASIVVAEGLDRNGEFSHENHSYENHSYEDRYGEYAEEKWTYLASLLGGTSSD